MLHQVVPHVHHEHLPEESASKVVADHHHHGGTHQHSHDNPKDEEDDKSEPKDFWGFLLGNHTHGYHAEFNQRKTEHDLRRKAYSKDMPLEHSSTAQVDRYEDPPPLLGKHPPNPNYRVHLSSLALRGPPVIG